MGNWTPGDVPFVQTPGQWQGTDFTFNENAEISPPGQQYQIVATLPSPPVASQEGTLFYVLGTTGVSGKLYILERQADATLAYILIPAAIPAPGSGPSTVRWTYFCDQPSPDTNVVWIVPYAPNTALGILTPIVWSVTDIAFRQEIPGTTNSTLQILRSTGVGAFVTANVVNVPINIVPGQYEALGRPFTSSTITGPTLNSGDKLGLTMTKGTGTGNWHFYVTMTTPGI
jgi:hypothetical protein